VLTKMRATQKMLKVMFFSDFEKKTLKSMHSFEDQHMHNTQPFYCSAGICPGLPG